jgi:hypothetical protein
MSAMRRAVNAFVTSWRSASWRGGSRAWIIGSRPWLMSVPSDENALGSPAAARTSSKRESAQKPASGSW